MWEGDVFNILIDCNTRFSFWENNRTGSEEKRSEKVNWQLKLDEEREWSGIRRELGPSIAEKHDVHSALHVTAIPILHAKQTHKQFFLKVEDLDFLRGSERIKRVSGLPFLNVR